MKYLLIMTTVIITMSTSCTRTYTCRCDGGALGTGQNIDIENKTKEEAEKECDSHNSSGVLSFHNCHLK